MKSRVARHIRKKITPTKANFSKQNPVQKAVIIGQEIGHAYRSTANGVKATKEAAKKTKARAAQIKSAAGKGLNRASDAAWALDGKVKKVVVGSYTRSDGTTVKSYTRDRG